MRSVLGIHWKDWGWSWNSNTLGTSWEAVTHWKKPWCWEGLGAGREGDDRWWDGWMASPTWWTWVWVNYGSLWWTGRSWCAAIHGVTKCQTRLSDWTELNWCCSLRLQNFPQTHLWECFLVFGNFSSFKTPFPGWITVPTSFVSPFIFFILSYLLLNKWAAFLGAWCPLPAFRNCFVKFSQHSNVLLINLWGRKWSPRPTPLPS